MINIACRLFFSLSSFFISQRCGNEAGNDGLGKIVELSLREGTMPFTERKKKSEGETKSTECSSERDDGRTSRFSVSRVKSDEVTLTKVYAAQMQPVLRAVSNITHFVSSRLLAGLHCVCHVCVCVVCTHIYIFLPSPHVHIFVSWSCYRWNSIDTFHEIFVIAIRVKLIIKSSKFMDLKLSMK